MVMLEDLAAHFKLKTQVCHVISKTSPCNMQEHEKLSSYNVIGCDQYLDIKIFNVDLV